jgi:hypothetical protein
MQGVKDLWALPPWQVLAFLWDVVTRDMSRAQRNDLNRALAEMDSATDKGGLSVPGRARGESVGAWRERTRDATRERNRMLREMEREMLDHGDVEVSDG